MYNQLKTNEKFSDKHETWIIAYCIDTDSFFCTDERYFWWKYEKEFNSEYDGINFFRNNVGIFVSQRESFRKEYGGLSKQDYVFLENTKERIYL